MDEACRNEVFAELKAVSGPLSWRPIRLSTAPRQAVWQPDSANTELGKKRWNGTLKMCFWTESSAYWNGEKQRSDDHRVAWFKASSILAASRQASIPPCLRNWSTMTFMP